MKKYLFSIIILSAVMLTSCLEGSSNYVPSISVSYFISSTGDTIGTHYNSNEEFYYLDSLSVGDTILFAVGFSSYANNLVSTNLDWDSTKIQLTTRLSDEFAAILTNTSDTAALYYCYQEGYNYAELPIWIVPLRSGESRISFSVESDAEKIDNTYSAAIRIFTR